MSLVNITDTAIQPKSLHFTNGGVFEPDPVQDTLQAPAFVQVGSQTNIADNAVITLPLGSTFTTGHAYHINANIAVNVLPPNDMFLSSWEIGCRMSGVDIYSTASHWSSISKFDNMGTRNVSLPISFIIVADTSRRLDLYFTANPANTGNTTGTWNVNDDATYVVTGKASIIDLGQITLIENGVTPPPPPLPPNYDPVPDLLTTQGGIYNNLAGFVTNRPTNYIYPPIV
jgi:hypothetical protein